jgi:hypothetical protein
MFSKNYHSTDNPKQNAEEKSIYFNILKKITNVSYLSLVVSGNSGKVSSEKQVEGKEV